jgi:hypothetical protein
MRSKTRPDDERGRHGNARASQLTEAAALAADVGTIVNADVVDPADMPGHL